MSFVFRGGLELKSLKKSSYASFRMRLNPDSAQQLTFGSKKANNGRSSGGEDSLGGPKKIGTPNFGSALLASKNRLAPQRNVSLPRLELQGAVTASRLAESILLELDKVLGVTHEYLWRDSTIVCAWVRSESGKFVTFVADRVAEIQENTVRHADAPCQLRHVKGIQNPADLLTRGLGAEEFLGSSDFWLYGPEWLQKTEEHWPAELVSSWTQVIQPHVKS